MLPFRFEHTYQEISPLLFSKVQVNPVRAPELILWNQDLAGELDLGTGTPDADVVANVLSGSSLLPGSDPVALAYCGHQFGYFTKLGDGRALLLGEHVFGANRRVDVQLKGSGPTPYSRRGDGRASLGPMLREFLISEAMHYLGIPTTRSLAVVTTGEPVFRETIQTGAVLTRIAQSHMRVGTFEYATTLNDVETLSSLVDYVLERHYPHLRDRKDKAIALLEGVMSKQVDLVVEWMRVGFIHGVMNTDNVSLCGETLDYGPCAFMDSYDPQTVFSSIDSAGRYAYGNQPVICQWNMARLAETLLPLIHEDKKQAIAAATRLIEGIYPKYHSSWAAMMSRKIGFLQTNAEIETLVNDLLEWMRLNEADFCNTFSFLSGWDVPNQSVFEGQELKSWIGRWHHAMLNSDRNLAEAQALMKAVNPVVIPRNHLVERALTAFEDGKTEMFLDLWKALRTPYTMTVKDYQMPPKPSERVCETFCGT